MPDKMDRRKLRTRALLRQALLSLMKEKGLEQITVSDLTSRADINRGTFYLHYKDVPDMVEQEKNELLQGLRELMSQVDVQQMMEQALTDLAHPSLIDVYAYIAEHSETILRLLGPGGDSSFADQFIVLIEDELLRKLPFWQFEEERLNIPRDYLIAYVSAANLGFLSHWLNEGAQLSPEEFANMVIRLVRTGPIRLTSETLVRLDT
ncbi:AcrR family transcriptional regulator [Paenibacillus phyllosphaerae]|uniref:AcrR family transcriptional regulator n=1 Tax=Paenibacillus phyllosphaerae TaxID=274593 RepID=A0A7W5B3A0_9BACL|nr:TetR/AcrR family transcriptional regulator [Paenibacillus phyllosphaerae]MBB3113643.1 AcrR family transcriptional regulator [Paenibacillus phyllosphaerae]